MLLVTYFVLQIKKGMVYFISVIEAVELYIAVIKAIEYRKYHVFTNCDDCMNVITFNSTITSEHFICFMDSL